MSRRLITILLLGLAIFLSILFTSRGQFIFIKFFLGCVWLLTLIVGIIQNQKVKSKSEHNSNTRWLLFAASAVLAILLLFLEIYKL